MERLHKTHINLLTICLLVLSISTYSAQDAGTVNFFLLSGYGIPLGGYTDTNLCSREFTSGGKLIEDNHYLNYGHGLQIETGIDYYFLKTLNMRVSFCVTGGFPPLKVIYKHADGNIEYTDAYNNTMLGINLKLIPHVPINKSATMYAGIGAGCYYTFLKISNTFTNDSTHPGNGFFKTSPGLGLNGVLGFDYLFTSRTATFFECTFDQISFNLQKQENMDGSKIDYKKNSPYLPAPRKIPGSNIGFRIGIKFTLFKPSKGSEIN